MSLPVSYIAAMISSSEIQGSLTRLIAIVAAFIAFTAGWRFSLCREFVPVRPADRRSIPDDVPWQFQRRSAFAPRMRPLVQPGPPPPLSTPRRFPLTANFRSQNRGVLFKQHRDSGGGQEETGQSTGLQRRDKFIIPAKRCRNDAARAIGWRGNNLSAAGIFFAYRNREGIDPVQRG